MDPYKVLGISSDATDEEVKRHIEAFIAGVEHPLFKQAAEETWLERQKTLSAENFKIRNLL